MLHDAGLHDAGPQDAGASADRTTRQLVAQARKRADFIDLFGEAPPPGLTGPYPLGPEGLARNADLQKKYIGRRRNIRRSWNRLQLYLPELLGGPPQAVLEMSTAHGAMLEILRAYGHEVMGTDYANMAWRKLGAPMSQFRPLNDPEFARAFDDHGHPIDPENPDWPYRHIVESVGLPVTIFDAGHLPYPFADKSWDVVLCLQAIEHYCRPEDWPQIVAEFCRIARRTVFVLLNPMQEAYRTRDGYAEAFDGFRRAMRGWRRDGFVCTSAHVHWGEALGFKLQAMP